MFSLDDLLNLTDDGNNPYYTKEDYDESETFEYGCYSRCGTP